MCGPSDRHLNSDRPASGSESTSGRAVGRCELLPFPLPSLHIQQTSTTAIYLGNTERHARAGLCRVWVIHSRVYAIVTRPCIAPGANGLAAREHNSVADKHQKPNSKPSGAHREKHKTLLQLHLKPAQPVDYCRTSTTNKKPKPQASTTPCTHTAMHARTQTPRQTDRQHAESIKARMLARRSHLFFAVCALHRQCICRWCWGSAQANSPYTHKQTPGFI